MDLNNQQCLAQAKELLDQIIAIQKTQEVKNLVLVRAVDDALSLSVDRGRFDGHSAVMEHLNNLRELVNKIG